MCSVLALKRAGWFQFSKCSKWCHLPSCLHVKKLTNCFVDDVLWHMLAHVSMKRYVKSLVTAADVADMWNLMCYAHGHWKWHQSIDSGISTVTGLTGVILHRFRGKERYWSKIAIFSYPLLLWGKRLRTFFLFFFHNWAASMTHQVV